MFETIKEKLKKKELKIDYDKHTENLIGSL
jgi:hypothetical protein